MCPQGRKSYSMLNTQLLHSSLQTQNLRLLRQINHSHRGLFSSVSTIKHFKRARLFHPRWKTNAIRCNADPAPPSLTPGSLWLKKAQIQWSQFGGTLAGGHSMAAVGRHQMSFPAGAEIITRFDFGGKKWWFPGDAINGPNPPNEPATHLWPFHWHRNPHQLLFCMQLSKTEQGRSHHPPDSIGLFHFELIVAGRGWGSSEAPSSCLWPTPSLCVLYSYTWIFPFQALCYKYPYHPHWPCPQPFSGCREASWPSCDLPIWNPRPLRRKSSSRDRWGRLPISQAHTRRKERGLLCFAFLYNVFTIMLL